MWSLSWILKTEEGWIEKIDRKKIEISSKGVVDKREEGGGRGGKRKILLAFPYPPHPAHFAEIKHDCSANYR